MDCTPSAGQTRAAPTHAVVKALLMAHDEPPGPVFWPNPGGRVGGTQPGETATAGTATRGVAAKMMGVATTTTTAAGVTTLVEAGEAHRVLVWLRAPPRGQLWSNNQGSWPQLWRRQRRAEERRERIFGVGRLVNLLPPVFVFEHGRPQRGGRGSRQEVSRAIAGGASGPEAFTLLLRLLMTHFDGVDTDKGYTKLHVFGMCNGMPFSDFSRELHVVVPRYGE